ncbi:beta-galactosidase trimerization domain-containing protein [Bacillus licheniformis]|nr:beta-galactosidase trimerization domain-containing protein [Bacillus licheniformis]
MLYLASEETIARLKAFAANGGTLVMTYISGIVNESDLTYLGGWPKICKRCLAWSLLKPIHSIRAIKCGPLSNRSYELKDYATVLKLSTADPEGFYEDDFMRTRRL